MDKKLLSYFKEIEVLLTECRWYLGKLNKEISGIIQGLTHLFSEM